MAWSYDSAIQLQNMVAQISTRLQGGGWTLYDNVAGAPVLSSVNNQGVTMYLQVTQTGTYTAITIQGWKSWNASTHVGATGSGTRLIYFGPTARGATEVADLYMSVTNNRAIIAIYDTFTNYRTWGYAGGLGSLAGSNDSGCYFIYTTSDNNSSFQQGLMLQSVAGATTNWTAVGILGAGFAIMGTNASVNLGSVQGVMADGNKPFVFPIYIADWNAYATSYSGGLGGLAMRGEMDGFMLCPLGNGGQNYWGGGLLSHLDQIVISGVTYLVFQHGGHPSNGSIPLTSGVGYGSMAIAIAEV